MRTQSFGSSVLLALALTGCPTDPGTDTGPGTDAPGADVPMVDAPVTPDAPVGCTVTGYPALDAVNFASGLTEPVYVAAAPGTTDLFAVERAGRIQVLDDTGAIAGTFLDIRAEVADAMNEQGLLGLAFHPNYATNGLFYVYYTDARSRMGGAPDNVVAVGTRADARTANPDVTVILRIPDFEWNHNGGPLQFGPDGELYIGTGDGGGGGDPRRNGQDVDTLLGKMLRIHVDETTADSYTIPPSNPFLDTDGADEIYAIGLRNPWRFSFDRATGDLYIGDVGQNAWEELDIVDFGELPGMNFGWNTCEGLVQFGRTTPCTLDHHEPAVVINQASDPVVGAGSASVIGGYVYRGSEIPGLSGAYLFADPYGDYVAGLRYCDGAVTEYQELTSLSGLCSFVVSFGQDNNGELYMVCIGSGRVMRIVAG